MPGYRRNNYRRWNNRKRYGYNSFSRYNQKYGLAVKPKMMPRSYKWARENQVDTRTFWFKHNGIINLNDQPYQYYEFRTNFLYAINPQGWSQMIQLYDQFKILGFRYKLFPASVGIEATGGSTNIATPIWLNRGNHLLWKDQRFDPNVQLPTAISDVINTASARLINARQPYTMSIWRPKGKYIWGSTKDFTGNQPDPWTGSINHFIEGGNIQPVGDVKTIYYYTLQFKVVFRGRQDD